MRMISSGRAPVDERRQRPADQVLRHRARRIEGPRRLAAAAGDKPDPLSPAHAVIVQDALVDRAELFDAEVRVGDPRAGRDRQGAS